MERGAGTSGRLAWNRAQRRAGVWSLGAIAVVGLLLVGGAAAAPGVSAGPPGTAYPPYAGIPYELLTTTLLGCGKMSVPVLPVFNTTTGRSHQSAAVSLVSCVGVNGTAEFEVAAGIESLPLTNLSTGHHNLTAHWSLSYKAHVAATPGAPKQKAFAEYEIGIGSIVYDATAGGNLGGVQHNFLTQHNTTHGSYYHNVTDRAVTTYFNVTLNRTHVYELYLIVVGIGLVEVGPGASTAVASLNLGPGTNGTRLNSVRFA